ncbi:MAG TPA: hypothetical protein VFF78_05830, partial [Anaerolineaceae bacterium]|nr:hypothetical protein [Anaerolineaceae bacterium]
ELYRARIIRGVFALARGQKTPNPFSPLRTGDREKKHQAPDHYHPGKENRVVPVAVDAFITKGFVTKDRPLRTSSG